jgi:copper chaperone CopZ
MIYKIAGVKTEEHVSGDIVLEIMGMASSKCEDAIKAAVLKCKGVKDAKVSYKEGNAMIKVNIFEVDVNELKEVAENSGFSVGAIYFNTEI